MKTYTFEATGYVPADTVMHLTGQQAIDRKHFLTPLKGTHKKGRDDTTRLPFKASRLTQFIAGSEVGLDEVTDRHLIRALGIESSAEKTAAAAKAKAKDAAAEAKNAQAAVDQAKSELNSVRAELTALRAKLGELSQAVIDADALAKAASEELTAARDAKDEKAAEAAGKALDAAEDALDKALQAVAAYAAEVGTAPETKP